MYSDRNKNIIGKISNKMSLVTLFFILHVSYDKFDGSFEATKQKIEDTKNMHGKCEKFSTEKKKSI